MTAHGSRDRKRVAFDRLLARLAATGPERWLLKGGFALELRLRDRARATKDVDLEWQANGDELLDALIDAAEHDAGDYFTFQVERTRPPPERLGGSQRFRVSAALAGRPFEQHFLLDIAPREDADRETVHLTTSNMLAFAGIEPVHIAAIPLERHLAEKLHAYTRTFDDKLSPRRAFNEAGFQHVVDAGLGAGPVEYLDMVLHTFPGSDPAAAFPDDPRAPRRLGDAYEQEIARQVEAGGDDTAARCGILDFAGITVGAAFVGTVASTLVIADILRLLHAGGESYSVIALDLRDPRGIRAVPNSVPRDLALPPYTRAR